MDKIPIVEVVWVDAGLEGHQLSIDDARQINPMPRKNVGYLLLKDKERVVLCAGFIKDREQKMEVCDQTLVIPRGCIQSIDIKEN